MSDLLEKTELQITDDGDHDKFAHYVDKEDIVKAALEGVPVFALCGKQWVPNARPDKYPVCQACAQELEKYKP